MLARESCPTCDTRQVVIPPLARGRYLATCAHCGRPWSPSVESSPAASPRCREHPERVADRFCDACESGSCARCREAGGSSTRNPTSPCCGAIWLPRATTRVLRPFWHEPGAVLAYPLQRDCLFVIVFLMAFEYVPAAGLLQPFLLVAYAAHVLRVSSRRPGEAPGFPDFDSVAGDILLPLFRLLAAGAVAFGPLLLYWTFTLEGDRAATWWILLASVGVLLLPLTVLLVTVGRSVAALADLSEGARVVRAIWPDYALSTAALAAIGLAGWALSFAGNWSTLLAIAARGVQIYLFILAFHLLGRMIFQTQDRVRWEV